MYGTLGFYIILFGSVHVLIATAESVHLSIIFDVTCHIMYTYRA